MVRTHSTLAVCLAATLLVGALASGCGASSSGTGGTDGATIVDSICGRCHPLQRIQMARHDRAGWTATIARMRAHGAQLTDQQAQAVIDYLTKRDGGS